MTRQSGRRDQQVRAALAPRVEAGLAICWRCGLPIEPHQPWDAGHLDDIATGGDPAGPRLPEHRLKAHCPAGGNRSNGARIGLELRGRRRRRAARLREWLEFLSQPLRASLTSGPFFSHPRIGERVAR